MAQDRQNVPRPGIFRARRPLLGSPIASCRSRLSQSAWLRDDGRLVRLLLFVRDRVPQTTSIGPANFVGNCLPILAAASFLASPDVPAETHVPCRKRLAIDAARDR